MCFRMINTTNRLCRVYVRSYKNQLQQIKICKWLKMFHFGHRFVIFVHFSRFPLTLILHQMFFPLPRSVCFRRNRNGNYICWLSISPFERVEDREMRETDDELKREMFYF